MTKVKSKKSTKKKNKVRKKISQTRGVVRTLMVLLVFFGLFILSLWVYGIAFDEKVLFTLKTGEQKAITPPYEDEFFQNCHRRFFYCSPSQYSRSRKGWDSWCYCFKPRLWTYVISPVLVISEYQNSGNISGLRRVKLWYWLGHLAYLALITTGIFYCLDKTSERNAKKHLG